MPIEATSHFDLDDISFLWSFNRAWLWAVHLQSLVTAPLMVMSEILR